MLKLTIFLLIFIAAKLSLTMNDFKHDLSIFRKEQKNTAIMRSVEDLDTELKCQIMYYITIITSQFDELFGYCGDNRCKNETKYLWMKAGYGFDYQSIKVFSEAKGIDANHYIAFLIKWVKLINGYSMDESTINDNVRVLTSVNCQFYYRLFCVFNKHYLFAIQCFKYDKIKRYIELYEGWLFQIANDGMQKESLFGFGYTYFSSANELIERFKANIAAIKNIITEDEIYQKEEDNYCRLILKMLYAFKKRKNTLFSMLPKPIIDYIVYNMKIDVRALKESNKIIKNSDKVNANRQCIVF